LSPDRRQHRGPHPDDAVLFSDQQLQVLRTATSELSWLLTRAYKQLSSLKLVGDRHGLTARQRMAIARAACSDQSRQRRRDHCVSLDQIKAAPVIVDGFNLIITVEAALSGGVLLSCRDDCIRDVSGVHGSYRTVLETEAAVLLLGRMLEEFKPSEVRWLFDRPISNSGRLARLVLHLAERHGWPWSAAAVMNPDKEILATKAIAITSDSSILEQVESWANLSTRVVERIETSWCVNLADE